MTTNIPSPEILERLPEWKKQWWEWQAEKVQQKNAKGDKTDGRLA